MVWETSAIIGLVAGLFGALISIAAIIYALGYFEYLGGRRSLTSRR